MKPRQSESLFDQPTPLDVDAIAEHIAANAPRVQHPDRTSEAARDQGWGPVETPASFPVPKIPKGPQFEVPGIGKGRMNPGSEPMSRTELLKGLTETQRLELKRRNDAGAIAARALLGLEQK